MFSVTNWNIYCVATYVRSCVIVLLEPLLEIAEIAMSAWLFWCSVVQSDLLLEVNAVLLEHRLTAAESMLMMMIVYRDLSEYIMQHFQYAEFV